MVVVLMVAVKVREVVTVCDNGNSNGGDGVCDGGHVVGGVDGSSGVDDGGHVVGNMSRDIGRSSKGRGLI